MRRREFVSYSGITMAGSWLLPHLLKSETTKKEVQDISTFVSKEAKFIWFDSKGEGRNLYANFRKTFVLENSPESALFSLFADSSYQLFINGQFIQQGPVRFDPRFPVFDTVDIAPYLLKGKNVIAVQANYFGMKTYKSIENRGGFIAWGKIKDGSKTINLDTNDKNWRCSRAKEYSKYVQKLSFALNPTVIFDQKIEDNNWKYLNFEDQKMGVPAIIENQKSWGTFSKRTIPFMAGNLVPIASYVHVFPLLSEYSYYSFSVALPNLADNNRAYGNEFFISYYTWIYSEIDQNIHIGRFWGENWLNGKPLGGIDSQTHSMRILSEASLKKGWNYFFGKIGPYNDVLNHYFSFPNNKGIIVSANKKLTGETVFFKRQPIVSAEDFNKKIATKELPFASTETLADVGGWVDVTNENKAESPCIESSWDCYEEQIEKIKDNSINGFIIKKEFYPNGCSILMDLGQMHLAYPRIELKNAKNATIDITYSEQLCEDGQHLLHSFNYLPGDRLICSENNFSWMPPHPRGIKYVKITVRDIFQDVTIDKFEIVSANYPITKIGEFKSSDQLLNAVWEMCYRTQKANMEDAYVDCSGRERGMYLRDTIIQYYNNLALFGDQPLMRRCMELYLQSPDSTGKVRAVFPSVGDYTIADFSLNLLEGLREYFDNTNDKLLVSNYWPAIVGNLKWFNDLSDEREDKLLDAEWDKKHNIDAHYGGFHGDLGIAPNTQSIKGIHCVFSLTYLIALQNALYLAQKINKTAEIENYSNRIAKLTASSQKFWNPSLGCYSDNLERETHSPHASLFAFRAGIIQSEQIESSKAHIRKKLAYLFVNGYNPNDGVYVSPSYMFYIFDGLYKAEMSDIAENLMRQGWGWCLYNGFVTAPEYFDKNPYNSMCHAWSASPVYYLSKYVLGISYPEAPNLDVVVIKPKTNTISTFEGKYPHPKGAIEVKWHKENDKIVFDYIKAPEGVIVKS